MTTVCVSFGVASCADSNEDSGGAGGFGGAAATTVTGTGNGTSASNAQSGSTTGTSASSGFATAASTTTAATTATQASASTGLPMIEGYEPEVEPNDDFLTMGNALGMGSLGFVGAAPNSSDSDVFTFQGAAGESRHIAISDGMGGCPIVGTSLQVQLFDPAGAEIASRFDTCPVLDTDLDVANLPVTGTYKVRVTALAPVPFYVLELGVIAVECGNGVRQQGESCDDGNLADGDGCDATCQVELPGGTCGEVEPNDTIATATPLVGCEWAAGTASSAADLDHFGFDVPAAGYSARVELVNVTGVGCAAGLYGALKLFDAAGTQIEVTETFTAGQCPAIVPLSDPGAVNLAAGHYTVVFDPGTNVVGNTPYAMHVSVLAPGCGDGLLQVGEACDDGDQDDTDFCTNACQLGNGACAEVEPNNSIAQANDATGCLIMLGGVTIAGAVAEGDYFSFDVTTAGSSVRIETVTADGSGCPAGVDNVIRLYSPTGVELGSDDQDGVDSCALISPTNDAWATNLPVGTYTVRMEDYLNNNAIASYGLLINVAPPGCGDGILQVGEECDDGNQNDADFCSNACELAAGICAEVEPNDSIAQANDVDGCILTVGGITVNAGTAEGDYFQFTVATAGSSVRIETVTTNGSGCPAGVDNVLRLYSPTGTELGNDDQDGVDSCALIDPMLDAWARNLPAGVYTVRMEDWLNNNAIASYGILVDVTPPGCGDGFLQAGEECEDGNVVNGDGCSDACTIEGTFCVEAEPNGTAQTATPLTNACVGRGAIVPANDVDRYSFQITQANSTVVIETSNGQGGCPGFDSFIRLYDTAGAQIATDDDGGVDICSKLTRANLAVGTYTFSVEEQGQNATQALYFVDATVTP